jgi:hypothetical protein
MVKLKPKILIEIYFQEEFSIEALNKFISVNENSCAPKKKNKKVKKRAKSTL